MMKKIYDLTELKHTFVSSKTKLFASLTIIIFMIVGCLHAQAQDDKLEASIDNLDKLTGCSDKEVKSKAISDNTFPTDDKSAIFFSLQCQDGIVTQCRRILGHPCVAEGIRYASVDSLGL